VGVSPHLTRAYELARPHATHPNPRVGAVVVSPSGEVLGEGAHEGPGGAHAETIALDSAGDAGDSTVYVSLEPCSHHGRTPPCVDRLIAERVAKVVVGARDPDPRVAGTGIEKLRAAGIEVEVVDDPDARELDPAYFHHRETGLPLVTLKYAMTLDGSVAATDATSRWITSEEARADAHALRASSDAVVVGSGTLVSDDPRLDVRTAGYDGPQPRPIVLVGASELPLDARVWERDPLVVATTERRLPAGTLIVVPGQGRPDPEAAARAIAGEGYLSILLEGGPTVAGAWWRAGLIDRGVAYVGAGVGGGRGMSPLAGVFSTIGDVTEVVITDVRPIGRDVRIEFRIER
jgi:diaminohydroxyphosphoribosylaminopyrimidine deaminase / 5-amino-6-(5-phosphoribosylamino)uracil reductase